MTAPAPRPQRGIALILVLWVLAIMILLGSAFSVSVRSEAQLSFGASERVRAGLAADAGVRRAVIELLAPTPLASDDALEPEEKSPSPRERRRLDFDFDGIPVMLEIIPESAFIDINVAAEPMIRGLVETALAATSRQDEQLVNSVTDSILDWRDLDDRVRDSGAEEADYRAADRLGPRNHPFLSVSELAEVAFVDRALFEAMRPMVTVFSFSPQIDPMAASDVVIKALPDAEAAAVEEFVQRRAEGAPETEIVPLLTSSRAYLARRSTPTYTVLVQAVTSAGIRAIRRVVVKVSPRAPERVAILTWSSDAGGQPLPEKEIESDQESTDDTASKSDREPSPANTSPSKT